MAIRLTLAFFATSIFSGTASCQDIADTWRYTNETPASGWEATDFDDSKWTEGDGGFGTRGTPGARIGTNWDSEDIWLRKTFSLTSVPAKPALLIHHDEDVAVFINGKQVASMQGFKTAYAIVPLGDHRSVLNSGSNLMAVHCHQTGGGQFIDVHVIDAENVPKLPRPKRDLTPFQSELITEWGANVTAENAWQEYPRPQMERDNWQNLNGSWDYAITDIDRKEMPGQRDGQILVPFSLESRLSGVGRMLDATEALWYRRTIHVGKSEHDRTLLNFEAVDYRCEVFINGQLVGKHQGGHTPFSIDVTDALRAGDNELVVRVEDETEGWQLRGKQVLNAHGIWYTQVSGIWQTVWLENVPATYIEDLKISTDAATGVIRVRPEIGGEAANKKLRIVVTDGEHPVGDSVGEVGEFLIPIPNAKLWSPSSPHLYGLEASLLDATGTRIDQVKSYAGIRTVGKIRDQDGHLRFTLNGKPIFHWGPLDQGWWPDGLLTPPSDDAMRYDIEFLKSAGFNMIRKHIKVEPRRYYYHCDRIGMMVWQDQVSAGNNPPWTRLKQIPKDADWPDEHHEQFMIELERMIDGLENHPSIVVWVPFNEAWGQHRTLDVGAYMAERDPSRLINIASGGNFWPIGDIVDHHSYPHPDFPFDENRYKDHVKVIGEFGGHGYPVDGHLWDASRDNWGYGGLPKTKQEYKQRYITSLEMLDDFRRRGIAGGIYTQTTDVEGEINGLMTYDRKVQKISADELDELHQRLFE